MDRGGAGRPGGRRRRQRRRGRPDGVARAAGAVLAHRAAARHARDPQTLIALMLNGQTLDLDHGYPCRLIAPARPGVLQTKWLSRVEVIR